MGAAHDTPKSSDHLHIVQRPLLPTTRPSQRLTSLGQDLGDMPLGILVGRNKMEVARTDFDFTFKLNRWV
jgi:hypothetical protein